MGFFQSLFGRKGPKNVEVLTDRVWMTGDAKFRGIGRELTLKTGDDVDAMLIVAHFPDVLLRLQKLVDTHSPSVPFQLTLARDLDEDLANSLSVDESTRIQLTVAERHPWLKKDEELEQFVAELPCRTRVIHHVALDDAVMWAFVGEAMTNILKNMGMSDEEAIESKVVSRRIKDAQRRLAIRVRSFVDTDSAAEWLEENCAGFESH